VHWVLEQITRVVLDMDRMVSEGVGQFTWPDGTQHVLLKSGHVCSSGLLSSCDTVLIGLELFFLGPLLGHIVRG